MGEAFEAACKELHEVASFQWCVTSLPNEILQWHTGVNSTRFAYGLPR